MNWSSVQGVVPNALQQRTGFLLVLEDGHFTVHMLCKLMYHVLILSSGGWRLGVFTALSLMNRVPGSHVYTSPSSAVGIISGLPIVCGQIPQFDF